MGKSIEVKLGMSEKELTEHLLDELVNAALPVIEDGEVTAKMLEAKGIPPQRAVRILKGKVATGEMTQRAVYNPISQRKEIAYRKKELTDDK